MLLQQILILSVFVYALWLLPDNYIEKSVAGRCQPEIQQQVPEIYEINSSADTLIVMRHGDGSHKFILDIKNCKEFAQPIVAIETIWLDQIEATQLNSVGSKVNLKKANTGGRFFTYALDNSINPVELKMTPLMSLKVNFSIWEKNQYQLAVSNLYVYFSIFFSSFLTLLIINIIVYLQSRDQDYLRYLPFLISNILYLAFSEGVFHALGWQPTEMIIAPLWWLAAMSGYFGIRFIVTFTSMEKYSPLFTKYCIRYPSYLYLVGCLISILYLTAGTTLIRITLLWLTFIPWVALARILKYKKFTTIYVFLAWSALTLGVGARVLFGLNLMELNTLVIYGVILGSLFETLLLSLSLGYKIVQFREGQQLQLSRALTDVLTDLPNRRHLEGVGNEIFGDYKSSDNSVCVAIIDCDRFKEVNDTYGHETGDYVLKVIARKIRQALRSNDIVGRWGGEEFLCFLPDVTEATVNIVMTRLLDGISENDIHIDEHRIHSTVSIGLTFLTEEDNTISDAIRRADLALYDAKQKGRARLIKI